MKLTPKVNFTNNYSSFSNKKLQTQTERREKLLKTLLYETAIREMLVKITPSRDGRSCSGSGRQRRSAVRRGPTRWNPSIS